MHQGKRPKEEAASSQSGSVMEKGVGRCRCRASLGFTGGLAQELDGTVYGELGLGCGLVA